MSPINPLLLYASKFNGLCIYGAVIYWTNMPARPPFLYFRRKLPFTQKFLPAAGLVLLLDTRLSCPLEATSLQATEFLSSLPTMQGRKRV
jgi:hypothetical protein